MKWNTINSDKMIATDSKSGLTFKITKSVFPKQFVAHAGIEFLGSFESQHGAMEVCKKYDEFVEKNS